MALIEQVDMPHGAIQSEFRQDGSIFQGRDRSGFRELLKKPVDTPVPRLYIPN